MVRAWALVFSTELGEAMTILYNCKHSGDQYRITKFSDGEPESSYLCTTSECECPAGVRPMCRHREMLPKFIHRGAVNVNWWYDYDRGGWVDMRTDVEFEPEQDLSPAPAPARQVPYRKPNDGRRI